MTTPGPFVAVLITLLVVGAVVQLLVLTYRYRQGNLGPRGETFDGEIANADDRFDGVGKPGAPVDDIADPDVDPDETETIPCPRCETLNEATYTFCRNCAANISSV